MSAELYQRAGALADEIGALRDLAYHGDDPELHAEMKELDRISRSRQTLRTRSHWDHLDAKLRAATSPQVVAMIEAYFQTDFREKIGVIRHDAESRARVAIQPRLTELADRELELADRETNVAAREERSLPQIA